MRRIWRTILFSDESRFTLKFLDGRLRVWRLPGKRYSDGSVDRFRGGSLMVWGGIHFRGKTNLVVVRQNELTTLLC